MIRRPAVEHATGAAARVTWPDALMAAIDRLGPPAWVTYAVAAGCAALLLMRRLTNLPHKREVLHEAGAVFGGKDRRYIPDENALIVAKRFGS